MQVCGQEGAEAVQASIGPLLDLLSSSTSQQVRGSALAALAAVLLACKERALPLLPRLVPALLTATQSAVDALPSSGLAQQDAGEPQHHPLLLSWLCEAWRDCRCSAKHAELNLHFPHHRPI